MKIIRSLALALLCSASLGGLAQGIPPITLDASGHMTFWNGKAWIQLANVSDIPSPVVVQPTPPVVTANSATGLNALLPSGLFPDAPWRQVVTAPVHAALTAGLQPLLTNYYLHMDATLPYFAVDSRVTPLVAVPINNADNDAAESDDVLVPLSPVAASAVEQGSDAHLLLFDVATQTWIEMYGFSGSASAGYTCISKTVWDATYDWSQGNPRPFGYTSASVDGLPIGDLLVKYDEYTSPTMVSLGGQQVATIGHAMRITSNFLRAAGYSNGDAVWAMIPPASHSSPNLSGGPAAGMRLILDPAYDTSTLSGLSLVLANTAKTYGYIVADRGATGMFTATADSRWSSTDLDALKTIPATNLQVVTPSVVYTEALPQQVSADLTGLVKAFPTGNPPVISSFTWSNGNLAWQVSGATYIYIDKIGLVRGTSIAAPAGTYTLTASNPSGRVSSLTSK